MKARLEVSLTGLVLLVAVSLAISQGVLGAQQLPPEVVAYADMIFYNGKVLTADEHFTVAQAVAVRDGKFLAVGRTDRILRMAGPKTREIDLEGKTVVPGFIETHRHGWVGNRATSPAFARIGQTRPGLDGPAFIAATLEEGLIQVKEIVDKARPGKWMNLATRRNKVSLKDFSRWHLDKVTPRNPVSIIISPSEAVMNSLALEQLFDSGVITPDTIGVQKDPASGEPNGQLWGLAQGEFYLSYTPWPEDWDTTQVELQKEQLLENVKDGATTRTGRAQGLAIAILNEVYQAGELPLRVRLHHEFFRKNAKYMVDLRRFGNLSGVGDDWFKIVGTGPQQVDGAVSVGTMYTKSPKIRQLPNSGYGLYGKSYWADYPDGYVRQTIIDLNRHGWNITGLHNYGDASSELILEAFEAAAKEKPFKRRWMLDHNWFHTPETLQKAKDLGIGLSILPWWDFDVTGEQSPQDRAIARAFGGVNEPALYMYGPDYWHRASRARSLIDMGFKPMAESYGPALQSLQAFITRQDGQGRVWAPEERVTRQEALWMKTNWSAYYSMEEDKLGTIEVGKLADLVVLGGDYMTVPADEISKIPLLMTVVGGTAMFEEPGKF